MKLFLFLQNHPYLLMILIFILCIAASTLEYNYMQEAQNMAEMYIQEYKEAGK